ncbi:MAG: ribonucleoside-diphosphate reductase subunit alpha [Candidatus Nezhaarchaeales archaeon]
MDIVKRDGSKEPVKFDKIFKRISRLTKDLKNPDGSPLDPAIVSQQVIQGMRDGISSRELDRLAIEVAYSMAVKHPDFDKLALRLSISTLHKDTPNTFSECIEILHGATDPFGKKKSLIDDKIYKIIKKNAHILNNAIDYKRDYDFDYFGYRTLEKSYLLKNNVWDENGNHSKVIIERPQHMWMRVAVGIHGNDTEAAINTYEMLSTFRATHATPTLFNSGTTKNQLSSCFLMSLKDDQDSIKGIYDGLEEAALISQSAGGIGIHIHEVRSKGSPVYGTGGISNGIIPMLKVFNETMRYVDQGGGKRKGSAAIYLEPWHPDIFDFLDLRKNNGKEEMRARDLNLAVWAPDLFFERVKTDGYWTLMDPNKCPGLADVHSEEFNKLYEKYEKKGLGEKTIKARDVFGKILESCIETGQPYILAKDACNKKSNQKNLGTIRSSNLCAEIVEYSDPENTAVCNLASISLPACIDGRKNKKFNHDKLLEVTCTLTENLNKIIDVEYYPVQAAEDSNLKERPIGIGIQGLATAFAVLRMPFESEEAKQLNKDIFETMYYGFIKTSCEIAKKKKKKYASFDGSPLSDGQFQFDLWGVTPSDRYDWEALRKDVVKYGVYNSLGIALMPTASTSQIMGNTECFEPFTSNIYKRATLSGEFVQINKYLVQDLLDLGLWTDELRQLIIAHKGSIQNIGVIPDDIKALYKTVWEISQKHVIDMAADRGPYVCQSQSMNLYFENANFAKLSSAYMYAWQKGLKTLVYYTRSQAARDAIQFTVDKNVIDSSKESNDELQEGMVCSIDNPEDCEMCGA